jgi:glutaredoxin-dependent peroxiredoxin
MSATVGSTAPDFTLPNQDRQPVSLSAARGRNVVLAFFPAAFTSVCQKELCYFRDQLAALNGANATVYGISVDQAPTLKEFATQNALTFDLLSDFNKEAVTAFGVLNPDRGNSLRAVFVVDGTGVIRHREVTANPGVEPDYDAVHQALRGLQGT